MSQSARHFSAAAFFDRSSRDGRRRTWRHWAALAVKLIVLVAAAGAVVLTTATAAPPVDPVASVDPQRYAGTWYEVARIPNRFQARCAGDVTATYQPMEDGSLTVINRCRGSDDRWEVAVGRAMAADPANAGSRLKLTFLPGWLRWLPGTESDYWVVMLDNDYRYSVVSDPQRKYLWILSRTPALPATTLERLVSQLRTQGYPVDSLVPTEHGPRGEDRAMARRTQLII